MAKDKRCTIKDLKPAAYNPRKILDQALGELVPIQTIAIFLDLTHRRVNQLVNEEVLPKTERGKYPFLGCIKGYIKYLRTRAEGGSLSLTDERTRLTCAQAESEEIKVKALKGELIKADVAVQLWERVTMACRSRLLALPSKVAPVIVHLKSIPEVKDQIEKLIYGALNELSRIDPADYAKDLASDEDVEPAAETPHKRVGRPKKGAKPGGKRRAGTMGDLKG